MMKTGRYCYWSVAVGAYAQMMERCAASARQAGVRREFHVFTDRRINGCECYDAQTGETGASLFPLNYLRAGISKLNFDYFIWVDADSLFVHNPKNILDCLGHSPIHVPLTTNLSALGGDKVLKNFRARQYQELMTAAGIHNPVYQTGAAFWIVQHDAVDHVSELASHFRAFAVGKGFNADASASLGYAMQMLCANPARHLLKQRPDLWASDDLDYFQREPPDHSPWILEDPLSGEMQEINPAIIHLPHSKIKLEPPPFRLRSPARLRAFWKSKHAQPKLAPS